MKALFAKPALYIFLFVYFVAQATVSLPFDLWLAFMSGYILMLLVAIGLMYCAMVRQSERDKQNDI